MILSRGDVVTVALPGDYGKPRPAVVIQSNLLEEVQSVIVCQVTTAETLIPFFRLELSPTTGNGLEQRSWIMVEKITTTRLVKIGQRIGALPIEQMNELDALLMIVLGLAPGT